MERGARVRVRKCRYIPTGIGNKDNEPCKNWQYGGFVKSWVIVGSVVGNA